MDSAILHAFGVKARSLSDKRKDLIANNVIGKEVGGTYTVLDEGETQKAIAAQKARVEQLKTTAAAKAKEELEKQELKTRI